MELTSETPGAQTTSEAPTATASGRPRKRKRLFKMIGALVFGCLVILFVTRFIYRNMHFVETDDAQVNAPLTVISARIAGTITDVRVEEHQEVKAGELLVKIDPRELQNSINQAGGQLESLLARQREAEHNLARTRELLARDAATRQDYDDALANYQDLTNKLAAEVATAEQTRLNLSYTDIRAPNDAVVGKKSVERGQVVNPGQSLLLLVDSKERWIIANFKETQLKNMKKGQEVTIKIDAFGDREFKGHVTSFAPGSGSAFALIPPDNATGNYTKIVQRVPVRIDFEPDSLKGFEDHVIPGLSAVVEVRIK